LDDLKAGIQELCEYKSARQTGVAARPQRDARPNRRRARLEIGGYVDGVLRVRAGWIVARDAEGAPTE
jgi:hypothetical protein